MFIQVIVPKFRNLTFILRRNYCRKKHRSDIKPEKWGDERSKETKPNYSAKVWYYHIEKHYHFSPLSSEVRQLPESKKNGSCYYKGREGKSISNGVYDGQIQELFFWCILRAHKGEKEKRRENKKKKKGGDKRQSSWTSVLLSQLLSQLFLKTTRSHPLTLLLSLNAHVKSVFSFLYEIKFNLNHPTAPRCSLKQLIFEARLESR